MDCNGVIYKIQNKKNGKFYLGSTNNFKRRKSEHISKLRSKTHFNKHLQNSYNKHGENSFEFKVIDKVRGDLKESEQYYLDNLNPHYNINKKADRIIETSDDFTDEHKNKIRKSKLGSKNSLAKLNENQVKEIWKLICFDGVSDKEIASKYSVSKGAIHSIRFKGNWAHITDKLKGEPPNKKTGLSNCNSRLEKRDIIKITTLYRNGLSMRSIGRRYDTSHTTVSKIIKGKTYKKITNLGGD